MQCESYGTDFEERAGQIESRLGDIDLWLHPLANIGLYARAGGELSINAGGPVEKTAAGLAQLILGNGTGRLDVSADRGTVLVRSLPVAEAFNKEKSSDD